MATFSRHCKFVPTLRITSAAASRASAFSHGPGRYKRRPVYFGERPSNTGSFICRRQLHYEAILLPPAIFVGLLASLWLWKCLMMIVFQNKIIYMPGLPPNARREQIGDYASQCGGVRWREHRIRAADGTDLALCVTQIPRESSGQDETTSAAHVYILYFQGNASSIPPRLPDLSWVLRAVESGTLSSALNNKIRYTMVCLSYRGYWKSRGRPSEKGIRLDAAAAARWISQMHSDTYGAADRCKPVFLLWGQSIGAGVASNFAASDEVPQNMPIRALILETPFLSIRAMLETLYPQKWVPYRHLWPFLRNHLDTPSNIRKIAVNCQPGSPRTPHVFIVEAGRDELVPSEHGTKILEVCLEVGLPVERKAVAWAYHNEVMIRAEGRKAIASVILREATRAAT